MMENKDKTKLKAKEVFFCQQQELIKLIKDKKLIPSVDDFPKKGVNFKDISPLFLNFTVMEKVINLLVSFVEKNKIEVDAVASPEARGWIFGSLVANKLKTAFIMVRKSGKLPQETFKDCFDTEYSKQTILEMNKRTGAFLPKNFRVLVVDDIVATWGTIGACCRLVEKGGGKVVAVCALGRISFFKNSNFLKQRKIPLFTLVDF